MSVSKHEEKMINLQYQMRQNQSELQDYLADLNNWENDIKQKEETLKKGSTDKSETLPPVRNTVHTKKLKKKKREKPVDPKKPKRISGFDFRAWDKFDVDKALEEIETEEKGDKTSSSEYETDEEWEMERKKHLAGLEKDKGNEFLKKGDLEKAVEAYTKGMEFDATNAILPANRAMALLKQQKFGAAELDCTTSVSLDPLYIKAYLRRATARSGMKKLEEAIADYNRVLDLEPSNKQAKTELERLQKEIEREKEGPVTSSFTEEGKGIVKPIYKPLEERSKAPLRRIPIEEIGIELSGRLQPANLEQSDVAKKITAKEGEKFDRLFKSDPSSASVAQPLTETMPVLPQGTQISPTISEISSRETRQSSAKDPGSAINIANGAPNHKPEIQHLENSSAVSAQPKAKSVKSSEKPSSVPNKQSCAPRETGSSGLKENHKKQNGEAVQNSAKHNGDGSGDGFCVPQTSFQFQADFKLLKNKQDSFYQYFKAIPPAQYPKLFGQCLDADILVAVLKLVAEFSDRGEIDVYDILDSLTRVKRFSMTAMFLTGKDKLIAQKLMNQLESSGTYSPSDVSSLRKKYNL